MQPIEMGSGVRTAGELASGDSPVSAATLFRDVLDLDVRAALTH